MLFLSYIGSKATGGLGILHFPVDALVVILYGVVFWFISQLMAPKIPVGDMEALIANAPQEEPEEPLL